MAFGGFENKHGRTPMAEMNMVPLIDVMLVLLVIFIVTAPLLSHSVRIELPQASSKSIETTPAKIDLAIQSDGELLYNGNAVDRNTAQALFMEAARKNPCRKSISMQTDMPTINTSRKPCQMPAALA